MPVFHIKNVSGKREGLQNVLNFEDEETTEDVIKDNIDFLNKKDWEFMFELYLLG